MALGMSYRKEIRRAKRRVATGSSVLETRFGPIEYGEAGNIEGPAVLVIHGAGGGFDQGLDLAADLAANGFRVIAISRFGYLRTPLPSDASAVAQADAHAAVLDALHIRRCAVLGVSAGGPSAMQLALRHPGRVTALILMVAAAYAPPAMNGAPKRMSALGAAVMNLTLRSDFLFWLALRLAPRAMTRMILGTPPELVTQADAAEHARVNTILDHILPVSSRRLGLLNEAAVIPTLPRYELERLQAPTLLIAAQDDLYGMFPGMRYSSEHIPNARFIRFPTGGHMLVGHHAEVTAEIIGFLRANGTLLPIEPQIAHPTGRVPKTGDATRTIAREHEDTTDRKREAIAVQRPQAPRSTGR
jgi:pimeloyl-ACP methyl ester carboxylesterase